ncbi:MAG: GH3 auxin-responsive promoter family protein [Deltaproteobacteria bacterium]|nr:GH3 auxin-responsive promoter family protein [Deltaproteobacteria bacterium]
MPNISLVNILWKKILPKIPIEAVPLLAQLLFIRSWGRFSDAVKDPERYQREKIKEIINKNKDTEFGKIHGFNSIKSAEEYRERVPLQTYDTLEPYIERIKNGEKNILTSEEVIFFGRTSGTTGAAKFIPVTKSFLQEYKLPRRAWMRQVVTEMPGLVYGRLLTIHSPKIEGRTKGGIPYGSITVAMGADNLGLSIARGFHEIPMEVFFIEDFDAKYYYILRFALEMEISIIAAINPSTILLFAKKLTEYADSLIKDLKHGDINPDFKVDRIIRKRLLKDLKPNLHMAERMAYSLDKNGFVKPVEIWSKLCGLMCWKGGFGPYYISQFEKYFGNLPIMDYGYAATEGNFAIPVSTKRNDNVLIPYGHFLEFISEGDNKPYFMWELKEREKYRVIISASNGLYRYDINDIVEVTDFYDKTPCIRFLHKGGNIISITGEKITESHVIKALSELINITGLGINGFTVTVSLEDTPSYVLAIEPQQRLNEMQREAIAMEFDNLLRKANIEYDSKRRSQRLSEPKLIILKRGFFERYRSMQIERGAPDAHLKPPHLTMKQEIVDLLYAERE